jgi:uncharacterized membrane protein YcaP (DUF421 family)
VQPLGLIVRGTVMFWFLFLIFRFVLRRDAGSIGITDFLYVVILGDAAQNAMIGQADSVPDGMVLIATLVAWNVALDMASYRFPLIERFIVAKRLRLVHNGKVLRRNLRREFITMEELLSKLHEQGHEDLDKVKAMYLEPDGEISVIGKQAGQARGK